MVHSLKQLEETGQMNQDIPFPNVTGDHIGLLMYTSGTTGYAKGVLFKHRQILAGVGVLSVKAVQFTSTNVLPEGSRHLSYLPQAHILEFTQELLAFSMGVCNDYAIPQTLTDNSPLTAPGEKGDATTSNPIYMIIVPLILIRVKAAIEKKLKLRSPVFQNFFNFCLDYKWHWLQKGYQTPLLNRFVFRKIKSIFGDRLKHVLSGSAPLPADVHKFFILTLGDANIGQGCGTTETVGAGFLQTRYSIELNSIGFNTPLAPVMLESWTEGGYTINDPEGPAGEVILGGQNVSDGYLEDGGKWDGKTFFADENGMGWFRTGDIGRCDIKTGAISLIDRKKNLVKLSNGEFISLTRIEAALNVIDYIEVSCVMYRSDKRRVIAVIVPYVDACVNLTEEKAVDDEVELKHLNKPLLEEIKQALSEKLPFYEIPAAVCAVRGPWTPESGLVTGALKTRRPAIASKYQSQINEAFNSINWL